MLTRRLIILGSTGSIGRNTLDVVEHLNATGAAAIEVVGLAASQSADLIIQQAERYAVPTVAMADPSQAARVAAALGSARVLRGPNAALDLVRRVEATDLCAAIVGIAGLPATMEAIRRGLNISLANKETLVAAGPLVSPMAKQHMARIIPTDSEHSAIFQCLSTQRNNVAVKRIVLTASGGPFRTVDKHTMNRATVEQALAHPTWKMGPKITVDSATMMNKALEIVEAHWLFDLPADKIEVIIHPQSIAHSFVEFEDNSILAQLGPPDMKMPIQVALTYPDRPRGCSRPLDWSTLGTLEFEKPDFDKFSGLKLAYEVIEAGGTAGAVFNAADEAAVAAFLDHRLPFGRIVEIVSDALCSIETGAIETLDDVLDADERTRTFVEDQIATPVL